MNYWPRAWLLLALTFLCLLLTAPWAVAQESQDEFSELAKVKVMLKAFVDPGPRPAYGQWHEEIRWTYDLFLVLDKAHMMKMVAWPEREASSFVGNPLIHETVFLVPPGKRRYRLFVLGAYLAFVGRDIFKDDLKQHVEELELDLKPGQETIIHIDLGAI